MTQTIILCALILYLGVMNYVEKQKATEREKDLLNRLAAKSLQDYTLAMERLGKKPESMTINDLMEERESVLPVN